MVESESIWDAVQQLKAKGKIVIASFANAAASGGYLVATHADLVLAHPSTITGSIGVASLRPTVTQTFLDRFYLNVQSFFMGSKTQSLLHELEGEDLERHRLHIDEMYEMFKEHVCDGRGISPDEIEGIAGGRVYSGLTAFGIAAEAETLQKLKKAQNLLPLREEHPPPLEIGEVAQLDEDQATSPFATVQEPASISTEPVVLEGVAEPVLGPKGRGLIDSLAGICEFL